VLDQLAEFFGESPAVVAVRDTLRRLLDRARAGQRLPPVLLQGDTGTGKGLAARLLHRVGPRRDAPFVDVNCAALPLPLLEAELFGFARGAFTDARHPKPGLFHAAHRGVLFLDEIALLPAPVQAKLLTAIEDRAVRRLGSTRAEPADVWVLSASNANLRSAVAERRFRDDLYHRLAVVTIELPPLRERGRDILLLAQRFLTRTCAEYSLPAKRLDADAETRLLAHSWPGNVRELSNVIERAALLADGLSITDEALRPLGPRFIRAIRAGSSGAWIHPRPGSDPRIRTAGQRPAVTMSCAANCSTLSSAPTGTSPSPPPISASPAIPSTPASKNSVCDERHRARSATITPEGPTPRFYPMCRRLHPPRTPHRGPTLRCSGNGEASPFSTHRPETSGIRALGRNDTVRRPF